MGLQIAKALPFANLPIFCGLAGVGLVWLWLRTLHFNRRYAPGPPRWPIIGNLLHFPLMHPWLGLTEWKRAYGDVVYLHGLGNSVVVLNDLKAVNELLDRKGVIYSHRPLFAVIGELVELDKSTPLLPCDDVWKLHRKLARTALSPDAIKKYHIVQEDIAALLNKSLCDDPDDFRQNFRLAAGRIILSVTYGIHAQSYDDDYICMAEQALEFITKSMIPGAHLADSFPIRKSVCPSWYPHTNRIASHDVDMVQHLLNKPLQHVKTQMVSRNAPPSLTHHLLASFDDDGEFSSRDEYEETIRWMAGSLFGGRTCSSKHLSTYSVVLTGVVAMIMYPDAQARAQSEIDTAIGEHRLPTMKDKGSLPYVEAFIKEIMRWSPALPLSIARRTAQDDTYEGYHIPKGTTVLPNVWAISNDCDPKYPPRDFIPERFLDPNPAVDPATYAFGFGRRICPGRYLAENSIFIIVSTLLAAFELSPELDGQDAPRPFQPRFVSGLVSSPESFKCTIRPRSEERRKQVLDRASAVTL
ncbi:hypothetical protein PLEOSDRAFT_1039344 [Pleurotus ostreatus PC15]|uniref:Cytochrome P450 n=1 Tax=Pleurotus ostreatus (strain PC15) TaxID=1137138 RepID=A0A067NPK1_PLEO1|nr:hypothetical protein PLEOSDRAFT_1039344 [Pleurotus ostreatus PC15]